MGVDGGKGGRIARRRIEIGELRAGTMKGLCHGGADDTRANHAHQQALQTGKIVGDHARAKRRIVAGFDLAVAPRETS